MSLRFKGELAKKTGMISPQLYSFQNIETEILKER